MGIDSKNVTGFSEILKHSDSPVQRELVKDLLEKAKQGIAPDPYITVDEWAETYRYLGPEETASPGPYRFAKIEYAREITRVLSPQDPCRHVVFVKPAQVGGTEILNNWMGYCIHIARKSFMLVQPILEVAERYSITKLGPMIKNCDVLRNRMIESESRDTRSSSIKMKTYPGGRLVLSGANSPASMRMLSTPFIGMDEVDAYPSDVKGEGDPLVLLTQRAQSFPRRKLFYLSTPLDDNSRIWRLYEKSDKRLYNIACPHCGFLQPLLWGYDEGPGGLKWEYEDSSISDRAYKIKGEPWYECRQCQGKIYERDKGKLMRPENGAKWVARAESDIVGFHLNGLYAPVGWRSWTEIVDKFNEANRTGDISLLKSWKNTDMGEPWQNYTGKVLNISELLRRRRDYVAFAPEEAIVLTMGVDVQETGIYYEIVGHGLRGKDWGLEAGLIEGDTSIFCTYIPGRDLWVDRDGREASEALKMRSPWFTLVSKVLRSYKRSDGRDLQILATAVDSGYRSDIVYRVTSPLYPLGVYPIKGGNVETKPLISPPTKALTNKGVRLFDLNVHIMKLKVLSRLENGDANMEYSAFASADRGYDERYFEYLTAERLEEEYKNGAIRSRWKKIRSRNDFLDTRVYALAAFEIRQFDLEEIQKSQCKEGEGNSEEKKVDGNEMLVDTVPEIMYSETRKRRTLF